MFAQWFDLTNEKIAELVKLATAIDKANAKVRPLLSQLNILKSQKAFLTSFNDCIVDSPRKYYYAENDKKKAACRTYRKSAGTAALDLA